MRRLTEVFARGTNARRLALLNLGIVGCSGIVLIGFVALLVLNSAGPNWDLPVAMLLLLTLLLIVGACLWAWWRFRQSLDDDRRTRRRTAAFGAAPIFAAAGMSFVALASLVLFSIAPAGAVVLGLLLSILAACAGLVCIAVVSA